MRIVTLRHCATSAVLMLCMINTACAAKHMAVSKKITPVFVLNPGKKSAPEYAGYEYEPHSETVRFIYSPRAYKTTVRKNEKIYVVGSFNGWQDASGNEKWCMTPVENKNIWELEAAFADVDIPGDSGMPEFKFLKNTGEWQEPHGWDASYLKERNLFIDTMRTYPEAFYAGYACPTNMSHVMFLYAPKIYAQEITSTDTVYVVGTFNHWAEACGNPAWKMTKREDGIFQLITNAPTVKTAGGSGYPEFKFLLGRGKWQEVKKIPAEYVKNNNLWVNFDMYGDITPPTVQSAIVTRPDTVIITFSEEVTSESAVKLKNYSIPGHDIKGTKMLPGNEKVRIKISPLNYRDEGYTLSETVTVDDIADANGVLLSQTITVPLVLAREELEEFFASIPATTKKMGCVCEGTNVVFRLFGPRLTSAELLLFTKYDAAEPDETLKMIRTPDYIWEVTTPTSSVPHGTYYRFKIKREGEVYVISDPYAQANVHSAGKSIIVYPDIYDTAFSGWADNCFTTPPPMECVIYETHLANITGKNPVIPYGKHQYRGMTINMPGAPLNHLKDLGINVIEFLPLHEFQNGSSTNYARHYHWGYMTSLFFAPESSYSTDPIHAKQVNEFKQCVNVLHSNDLAVIVDVVYNHTSNVDNYLERIDPQYYFTGGNLSGCGNDTACHRPMMRKLIIDSLCHMLSTYHVDGFRFDLSHLIDQKDLFTPETIAKLNAAKPTPGDVILIGENWSQTRKELTGTGVAQWNDWFREDVKKYAAGNQSRDTLIKRIRGSQDRNSYASPLEVINYFESHDEETITHRLENAGYTSRKQQLDRAAMGAAILFTSQGIPMLWEGQEALRNRPAQLQDYDSNMLDWSIIQTNSMLVDFYKQLIELRKKYQCLRTPVFEDDSFYQWILPENTEALAYILNANKKYADEPRIAVCVNPDDNPITFKLPDGEWKIVHTFGGNGKTTPNSITGNVIVHNGMTVILAKK